MADFEQQRLLDTCAFDLAVEHPERIDLVELSDFLREFQLSIYRALVELPDLFPSLDEVPLVALGWGFKSRLRLQEWSEVTIGALEEGRPAHPLSFHGSLVESFDSDDKNLKIMDVHGLSMHSPLGIVGEGALVVLAISILLGGGEFEIDYQDNVLKVRGRFKSFGSAIQSFRTATQTPNLATDSGKEAVERIEPTLKSLDP